jgi:homogentisate 1,2-dioxygenase
MSELMVNLAGVYDAKESLKGGGFVPGGASLHSMSQCLAVAHAPPLR